METPLLRITTGSTEIFFGRGCTEMQKAGPLSAAGASKWKEYGLKLVIATMKAVIHFQCNLVESHLQFLFYFIIFSSTGILSINKDKTAHT